MKTAPCLPKITEGMARVLPPRLEDGRRLKKSNKAPSNALSLVNSVQSIPAPPRLVNPSYISLDTEPDASGTWDLP